jgi:hypothetical protein
MTQSGHRHGLRPSLRCDRFSFKNPLISPFEIQFADEEGRAIPPLVNQFEEANGVYQLSSVDRSLRIRSKKLSLLATMKHHQQWRKSACSH